VTHTVVLSDGTREDIPHPTATRALEPAAVPLPPAPLDAGETRRVPLGTLVRARSGDKGRDIEVSIGIVRESRMRRALLADCAGQAAGIYAADRNSTPCGQPLRQVLCRAPVAVIGRHPFYDHAGRDWICGLVILGVRAGIADVREGECHDLACVGWIGHDFLVARHGSVETHLRHGLARCAKSHAIKHGAIR
jgi:hypothetical protein